MPYIVTAKVKEIKGKCHVHKVGDKIEFIGNEIKGKICHSALHAIYPIAYGLEYGAEFPWSKDPDLEVAGCTDPINQVVFEIRRVRKLTDKEVEKLYSIRKQK